MEKRSSAVVAHPQSQTPFALKILLFHPRNSKINQWEHVHNQYCAVMFKKGFSNPRSHWFSNLGFHSGPVLLGENVTDVFDDSSYSDLLWISAHCCQGEEWSSRDTQLNVSVPYHNTDRNIQLHISQDGRVNYLLY